MNPQEKIIIVSIIALFAAAATTFVVLAYVDANKCLQWYAQRHKQHAWINQAPRPSKWQRILNAFLFIKSF
jgi:Skp family chaperone for outer membrane proteins